MVLVLIAVASLLVVAARSHLLVGRSGAPTSAADLTRAHDVAVETAAVERLIRAGHPVYCGGAERPLVALTFDDGPGPFTRHTLAVLAAHGVRATFFLVGKEVTGWPALVDVPRETARRNAIGDHTFDHVSVAGATAEALEHEIGDAAATIRAATGRPVLLFRPPFGRHDRASDAAVRAHGMLEVLWSVDTGDSTGATQGEVLDAVERHAGPGSIVLMHENRGTTQAALPRILAALRQKGLRPVTVPELLAKDPPTPEQLRTGACP